jgi:hypothetical protein
MEGTNARRWDGPRSAQMNSTWPRCDDSTRSEAIKANISNLIQKETNMVCRGELLFGISVTLACCLVGFARQGTWQEQRACQDTLTDPCALLAPCYHAGQRCDSCSGAGTIMHRDCSNSQTHKCRSLGMTPSCGQVEIRYCDPNELSETGFDCNLYGTTTTTCVRRDCESQEITPGG